MSKHFGHKLSRSEKQGEDKSHRHHRGYPPQPSKHAQAEGYFGLREVIVKDLNSLAEDVRKKYLNDVRRNG